MIIWINGCFDIIHSGHIELFRYARSLGEKLVVGIDTDDRVKTSKGESRPINSLEDRVKVVSSIRYVDEVVTFSSDEELLKRIKASQTQLIVVGSDYEGRKVIGEELVPVTFFRRIPNKSSTKIINEICF